MESTVTNNIKYDAVFFTDMGGKFYHVRPLGAYRLASELRNHGYSVLVVDFLSNWLNDKAKFLKLLKNIISDQTLFVGYSSTFFSNENRSNITIDSFEKFYGGFLSQWPAAVEEMTSINAFIKKLNPNIKILHGGAGSTPSISLKNGGVDYVVQGLADKTVVDIADSLKNKTHIKFNLQNNIKVIDSNVTGSNFNFPLSETVFHPSDFVNSSEVLPLETSRGCLFKCSFCAFPLLGRKKNDPDYHKHTDCIASEIKRNYDLYGITNYMFADDTFNESTGKLEQIYQAIQQSGVKINFNCYLRIDLLERYPEQIELLEKMGIQSCFLGIETLNLAAAKSIGKSSKPERIKLTLQKMKDIWKDNVVVYGSFIAGLPHETDDTINEWMQWVYDNPNLLDGYVIRALVISNNKMFPSDINKNPEKYGYTIFDRFWVNDTGMTYYTATELATKWMEKSWQSSRLTVAGHEMMALMGLGYTFDQLKKIKLNQLPFDQLLVKHNEKFKKYQDNLLDYVTAG